MFHILSEINIEIKYELIPLQGFLKLMSDKPLNRGASPWDGGDSSSSAIRTIVALWHLTPPGKESVPKAGRKASGTIQISNVGCSTNSHAIYHQTLQRRDYQLKRGPV